MTVLPVAPEALRSVAQLFVALAVACAPATGVCWEATFSTPLGSTNTQFKARSD